MTDLPSKEANSTVHFASCCSDVGHMNWKTHKKVVSLSPYHRLDKQSFTRDKNIKKRAGNLQQEAQSCNQGTIKD